MFVLSIQAGLKDGRGAHLSILPAWTGEDARFFII
jgi:hypothetical protein